MARAALAITTRQWTEWRKEGGEDLGPLAGSEDQIGNFARRPLTTFLLADVVDGFEDNLRAPHSASGMQAPIQFYAGWLVKNKTLLVPN